tara:strand:+ start:633 stop:956 length:324 start_codon:yes stop_codon:yes gene_type:complete
MTPNSGGQEKIRRKTVNTKHKPGQHGIQKKKTKAANWYNVDHIPRPNKIDTKKHGIMEKKLLILWTDIPQNISPQKQMHDQSNNKENSIWLMFKEKKYWVNLFFHKK